VGGDFVILSSQGGMNLYIGNNPKADGTYKPLYPTYMNLETEAKYHRQIAEQNLGRSLKPSEVSRYWAGRAWEFIRNHPGRFVRLLARKFHLFWNAYEIPDTESYYFYQKFSPVLKRLPVRFGLIAVLGFAGICVTLRNPNAMLPRLMVLGILAITLPFFVLARYRIPVVLPLVMFAACAAVALMRWAREKSWPKIGATAGIMAVSALFVYLPFPLPDLKAAEISTALYNIASILEKKGEQEQAIKLYRNAADAFAGTHLPRQRLMQIAFRRGELAEAETRAKEILAIHRNHAEAWFMLGRIYAKQGKPGEAKAAYENCLRADPHHPQVKKYMTAG